MRAKIDMDVRRGVLIHHYRYNPLFPSLSQLHATCIQGSSAKLKIGQKMIWRQRHALKRCIVSWPFWHIIKKLGTLTWPPCGLRHGLVRAMLGVLRLEPGGLLTAGLPCHSYVYLNRSTSKRSKDKPLGDQSRAYVRLSNMLLGLKLFIGSRCSFK